MIKKHLPDYQLYKVMNRAHKHTCSFCERVFARPVYRDHHVNFVCDKRTVDEKVESNREEFVEEEFGVEGSQAVQEEHKSSHQYHQVINEESKDQESQDSDEEFQPDDDGDDDESQVEEFHLD